MKKIFVMQDLDCANCAAKMENAIAKIDGVTYVNISFMAQRLTLEADDERFDAILEDVQKAVRRVDSDCRIIIK